MIIAISGLTKSGKDTLAEGFLHQSYTSKFYQLNFATYLKEIAASLWKFDKKNKEEFRKALQWLGDGARQFNENCWIDAWEKRLQTLHSASNFIITDLRYENEYYHLKNKGAILIGIKVINDIVRLKRFHPEFDELDQVSKTLLKNIWDVSIHTSHNSEKSCAKLLAEKPYNIIIEDDGNITKKQLTAIGNDICKNLKNIDYLKETYNYKEI